MHRISIVSNNKSETCVTETGAITWVILLFLDFYGLNKRMSL
jgi:hypothetical protein